MPISHTSKLYGVVDAKIAPLTADPAGGAATYGALIDVPGIKEVSIGGTVNSVELRGDNQSLDQDSNIAAVTATIRHAKINLDALAVMLGGTVTDSGALAAEVASYRQLGADRPDYFKFEAKCVSVDEVLGDGHIVLFKCKINAFPDLGFAEEDYRIFSGGFQASPRIADDVWFDIVFNETAAAIA